MPGSLPFLCFVVFGRELNRPLREERTQFPGGLFDAEAFGDMRVAQPLHDRSEAGGAFELLSRGCAGDLCLPVTKAGLPDHVLAPDRLIALEYALNERMLPGLG